MEGHNTHAGVAIGAAYAVKQAMQRYGIPGSEAGRGLPRTHDPNMAMARISSRLIAQLATAAVTACTSASFIDAS
jgi:hypothetical protein